MAGLLVNSVVSQPGVTFDVAQPCWINVTSSTELTYSEPEQFEIHDFVWTNIINAATERERPIDGLFDDFLVSSLQVQQDLYYYMAPPETMGDYNYLGRSMWAAALRVYHQGLSHNSEMGSSYVYKMVNFDNALHVCVDDEIAPNQRQIVRKFTEQIATGYVAREITDFNFDETVTAIAIALGEAFKAINKIDLDYEIVAIDIFKGVLSAYQKVVLENDAEFKAAPQTIKFVDDTIYEFTHGGPVTISNLVNLIMNITDDLGVEVDESLVKSLITGVAAELLFYIGGDLLMN
eukprot:TRINITY_DN567_c0_g1_i3.p2 TRINITY_DN567_c0_g1~~TRINITY_DN567_c0_g1_i3.p2  ORF type:complete len:292 (+),score=38.57 TRINITY_DN567_c0_g1_i3:358-1233(+)